MTRRAAASGRISTDCILLAAAIAATIYLLCRALNPNSFTMSTMKHAAGEPLPNQDRALYWQELDNTVLSAARYSGQENLVADLVDRRSPQRANRDLAAFFYGRATYALWPRRMFVTFPTIVITNGDQLAAAPVPKDAGWLAEHHAALVQFRVQDIKSGSNELLGPRAE
jgi:hypothetical protein